MQEPEEQRPEPEAKNVIWRSLLRVELDEIRRSRIGKLLSREGASIRSIRWADRGETVIAKVRIKDYLGEHSTEISGYAICSPADDFYLDVGRVKAIARALRSAHGLLRRNDARRQPPATYSRLMFPY